MNINFQQILVALLLLVPGFIATNIQRSFYPKRFGSDFQWTVSSLLLAIVFNGILLCIFAMLRLQNFSIPIVEALEELKHLSVEYALVYFVTLYLLSIIWGILRGSLRQIGFRSILNRIGLIPFTDDPSVWVRVTRMHLPKDRPIIWLKLALDDGRTVTGHLLFCSELIDRDKPFEIYLGQVHVLQNNTWTPLQDASCNLRADGVYMKLTVSQSAELYFREKGWSPLSVIDVFDGGALLE